MGSKEKSTTVYDSVQKFKEESVQEFSNTFMKTYNTIPELFRPPLGAAQLHYADAFEDDFALGIND